MDQGPSDQLQHQSKFITDLARQASNTTEEPIEPSRSSSVSTQVDETDSNDRKRPPREGWGLYAYYARLMGLRQVSLFVTLGAAVIALTTYQGL